MFASARNCSPWSLGALHELREVERLAERRQLVVEDILAPPLQQVVELLTYESGVVAADSGGQQLGEVQRLVEALASAGHAADVEQHHLAQHLADVAARVGVVAHIGHAHGREPLGAHLQDALLHVGRDPRIQPVRDDVVELAEVVRERAHVQRPELDIRETELRNDGLTVRDRRLRQVDPDEPTLGQAERHRNNVRATAAAELQEAAAFDRLPGACQTRLPWSQAGRGASAQRAG